MCEFVSWVELGDKIYFLTRAQVDSPQGQAIQKRFPGEGELLGHSAIRAYYELETGENKECDDFSTPDNFPDVIVKALKNGEFRDFSYPGGLLAPESFAHISGATKAYAAYVKADAAWRKARAAYVKARAAYVKACAYVKADAAYVKADAAWRKADAAWLKADAAWRKADAAWLDIINPYFWDLFAIPKNRTACWR